MPDLILELGMLVALTIGNTPYERRPFQQPYLLIEKKVVENLYFTSFNTSRTLIHKVNVWDPQTALWTVSAKYKWNEFTFELGHTSEHGTSKWDENAESFDFIKITYRKEYF